MCNTNTDTVRSGFTHSATGGGEMNLNSSPLRLVEEGDENFYRYIKKRGIPDDPDLIILSSRNHYYYGESDLKNVRTIINLKKLNLIKHPDRFLNSMIHILPPETNFLGCFSDSKSAGRNGSGSSRLSRYITRINNFLDSRTDRNMDQKEVTDLLRANGFEIFDMSRIDDVIYFHSKLV